jgi:PE family
MSFVVAATEAVASAAQDLTNIGSTIDAAGAVAGASTRGELAAAADQVSVAIGQMFSEHAEAYQGIRTQIADFHQQFVQAVSASGQAYATAEAENASPLQTGVRDLLG